MNLYYTAASLADASTPSSRVRSAFAALGSLLLARFYKGRQKVVLLVRISLGHMMFNLLKRLVGRKADRLLDGRKIMTNGILGTEGLSAVPLASLL